MVERGRGEALGLTWVSFGAHLGRPWVSFGFTSQLPFCESEHPRMAFAAAKAKAAQRRLPGGNKRGKGEGVLGWL